MTARAVCTRPSALFCVRQFPLSCRTLLPPGVEAAEQATNTVTCYHPSHRGWMARHRLVQNARPRANSYTASLHPELPRSLPSHTSLMVHAPIRINFHADGWAAGPCETLTLGLLQVCPSLVRRLVGMSRGQPSSPDRARDGDLLEIRNNRFASRYRVLHGW
jgi:hypothetical protein